MLGMVFAEGVLKTAEYEDSYEFIRENVDGFIEHVTIPMFDEKGIDVWVNEEGKFREDLFPSAVMTFKGKIYDYLIGNLVFTRCGKDGETVSLTEEDVKFIKKSFKSAEYLIDFASGNLLPRFSY